MFPSASKMISAFARGMATAAKGKERKVAVLGAAGGIGQPLSLLMKVRALEAPRTGGYVSRRPQSAQLRALATEMRARTGQESPRSCLRAQIPGSMISARHRQTNLRHASSQMNPAVSHLSLYDVANVSAGGAGNGTAGLRLIAAAARAAARAGGAAAPNRSPLPPAHHSLPLGAAHIQVKGVAADISHVNTKAQTAVGPWVAEAQSAAPAAAPLTP